MTPIATKLPNCWHGFSSLVNNTQGPSSATREKSRVLEITIYQCMECGDRHDDEDDAEECCAESPNTEGGTCPICQTAHADARNASDCCLWKDFDAATRWAMADAVEAGSTWVAEIGKKVGLQ